MNATIAQNNTDLDVIFPEGKEVIIARADKTVEKLMVMPMPLRKWKKGFKYIAQIAPALGFDLFGGTVSENEVKNLSGEQLFSKLEEHLQEGAKADAELLEVPALDTMARADGMPDGKQLYDALMGDTGDLIIEFMAFAVDKDTDFINGLYDEAVDVLVAVIEVNLNFFARKLLPKIITGTRSVVATAHSIKSIIKR